MTALPLNSDATYPEQSGLPQFKRSVPWDCPTPAINHKAQAVTCDSGQLAINLDPSDFPLKFNNCFVTLSLGRWEQMTVYSRERPRGTVRS